MLDDESEILGCKIKLEKNMLMKYSASKDDDTDSITEIIRSIIGWKLQIIPDRDQ